MCKGKIGDAECQTKYLILELKTYFPKVYNQLKEITDIAKCTKIFFFNYENPIMPGVNAAKRRIEYANNYYKNFTLIIMASTFESKSKEANQE